MGKPHSVTMLGTGLIGLFYTQTLHGRRGLDRVGCVYSRSEEHARAFARRHGIARWFTDIEQTLAQPDCDVADICLPNHLHACTTIAAARAGKHVIIEKPLCLTLEEADEMIAAC